MNATIKGVIRNRRLHPALDDPFPLLSLRPLGVAAAAPAADAGSEKEIELMIKQIEALETGAFAPLSRQPIFGALLVTFGGAGILAVLNYLAAY
jgi:hypothetical protein